MSMFLRLSGFSFLFVALMGTAACSGSDDGGGNYPPPPAPTPDSGGGGGNSRARVQKACVDLGDAMAKAFARCGATYQEAYDQYIASMGGPTCPSVVSIRDEASLRGTCFSWLETVACASFTADGMDASCQKQLLVRQSSTSSLQAAHGELAPSPISDNAISRSVDAVVSPSED